MKLRYAIILPLIFLVLFIPFIKLNSTNFLYVLFLGSIFSVIMLAFNRLNNFSLANKILKTSIFLFFIAGFLFVFILNASEFLKEENIIKKGIKVRGVVIEKRKKRYYTRGTSRNEYFIVYQFPVKGQRITNENQVSHSYWLNYNTGNLVEVLFLHENPNLNRLANNNFSINRIRTFSTLIVTGIFIMLFFQISKILNRINRTSASIHLSKDENDYYMGNPRGGVIENEVRAVAFDSGSNPTGQLDPAFIEIKKAEIVKWHNESIQVYAEKMQISSKALWEEMNQMFIFNELFNEKAYFEYLIEILMASGKLELNGLIKNNYKNATEVLQFILKNLTTGTKPYIMGTLDIPIKVTIYHL